MSKTPRLSRWDLLPLAGVLGLAALCLHAWDRLPEAIPTHWDRAWRPDAWTPKATFPWFVLGLPVVMWAFILLVGSLAVSRRERKAEVRIRAMAPLRGLLCLGACVLASLPLLIPIYGPGVFRPVLAGFAALVLAGAALMARDLWRDLSAEDRRPYKWGLFYYNPEDPRLWVEKLVGIGWTLNFARPLAWFVMALLLALPLGLLLSAAWRN